MEDAGANRSLIPQEILPGVLVCSDAAEVARAAARRFVDWAWQAIARDGLEWLDRQLAGRTTIVPGRFTLADVVLFAFVEFGTSVGQAVDPSLKHVATWLEATKARPSAAA